MPGIQIGGGVSVAGLTGDRVDLHLEDFRVAIKDKGYDVNWERSLFCPNRKNGLGPKDHPASCHVCDGTGRVYYGLEKNRRMLITGVSMSESYYQQGRWDSGQVNITAEPCDRLAPWDRITLNNGRARFQEMLLRQPNSQTDRTRYPILTVDYLTWVGRDESLHVAVMDEDFVVNSEREITWVSNNRPDARDYYSLAYFYRPRYIIADLMHQHRDSTEDGVHKEFPVQAIGRLDYLIRNYAEDDVQVEYQNPFAK